MRGRFVTAEQMMVAQRIFQTVGRTVVVDEKHMDAVTGLSGSGPAFLYIIIEALAEAGVNVVCRAMWRRCWRRRRRMARRGWCWRRDIIRRC